MVIVTSFDPSYIYPLMMSGCGFGRDVGTDVGNESTFFVNRLNSVSNRSEASAAFGTFVVIVTFDNVFLLSGVTSVVPFADCSRLFLRNQIVKRYIIATIKKFFHVLTFIKSLRRIYHARVYIYPIRSIVQISVA